MVQTRTSPFQALLGHSYLSLTTFRADGTPVPTTVWFALDGDKLYVMTQAHTGKVKRIHHNAQVEVAPCTETGASLSEPIEAMAMILPDGKTGSAKRALRAKYGLQKRIVPLLWRLRGGSVVYLEITPM
jgi:PPOX class probable F420-dependent enzyme